MRKMTLTGEQIASLFNIEVSPLCDTLVNTPALEARVSKAICKMCKEKK